MGAPLWGWMGAGRGGCAPEGNPGTQWVLSECILPLCRVLGHGFDLDEVPPPPAVKAPTLPSMEAYHSHGKASFPSTPVPQHRDKALPCQWFMPCHSQMGNLGSNAARRVWTGTWTVSLTPCSPMAMG